LICSRRAAIPAAADNTDYISFSKGEASWSKVLTLLTVEAVKSVKATRSIVKLNKM